jgi:hypothetical protein
MSRTDRLRQAGWSFWMPCVLSVLAVAATVASMIDPHWIESLFEASPDGGSGESEWGLTAGLAIAALISLAVTRWQWQSLSRPATAGGEPG